MQPYIFNQILIRLSARVTLQIRLHCKSLVQMAGTLHSNDVLQKPAWHLTPPQFPT